MSRTWVSQLKATLRDILNREAKEEEEISQGSTQCRIVIACQGGGSYTAFSAGALGWLLRDLPKECQLVGLSGTSGGAVAQ